MKTRLLVLGSFLLAFPLVASLSCVRPCSKVRCSTPVGCRGGTVKSVCGCCTVCAKMEGERCGGQWEKEGRCDSGLKCVVRGGRLKSGIGQCEPGQFTSVQLLSICCVRRLSCEAQNFSGGQSLFPHSSVQTTKD